MNRFAFVVALSHDPYDRKAREGLATLRPAIAYNIAQIPGSRCGCPFLSAARAAFFVGQDCRDRPLV